MKGRVAKTATTLSLLVSLQVALADIGDAPGKDKYGDPVGDALIELSAIQIHADVYGTVLLWVDMYHPFSTQCTNDDIKSMRKLAKEILKSLPKRDVKYVPKATNAAPDCAPGFVVRATSDGVDSLWQHQYVRSLGQLDSQ